jgi:quinol monooxygenase YgiN
MSEHASVVRIIRFRPAADRRADLTTRLRSRLDEIRQLEGCFGAQVCTLQEEPDVVAVISRWVSQSALDQFLSSTAAQRAEVAAMSTVQPTTETFVSV